MVELVTVERIRNGGRELEMADVDLVVPVSAIEGWSGQTAPGTRRSSLKTRMAPNESFSGSR